MVQNIISKIRIKIASLCLESGKRKGSLLLEIAVAISIMGVISGFFIMKTITANKVLRANVTKNNIDTVVIALAAHVANCRRLPRPSTNNDGYENNATLEDLPNHMGYVPFNTLGISEKTALDGNARPLIYIVEPFLASNFTSIYEGEVDINSSFCHPITDPKILIRGLTNPPDVIAFVIDTRDNFPEISDKITVTPSPNTVWMLRDMILMKYLKDQPCEIARQRRSAAVQGRPVQQANNNGEVDDVNFDF